MASVENAGVELGLSVGSSSRSFDSPEESVGAASAPSPSFNGHDQANHSHVRQLIDSQGSHNNSDGPILIPHHDQPLYITAPAHVNGGHMAPQSFDVKIGAPRSNGGDLERNGDAMAGGGESLNRDMRELQELFSKLNPLAEEFVPLSLVGLNGGFYANNLEMQGNNRNGFVNGNAGRRVCICIISLSFSSRPFVWCPRKRWKKDIKMIAFRFLVVFWLLKDDNFVLGLSSLDGVVFTGSKANRV